MSDVGLGANLELNITDALRRVDQLGRALEQASGVTIQVDTSNVAPEITRAVDAANTEVTVEADTTGVAPEITRSVDAADTGIVVDADTSDVAGSITASVDAADTGVIVTSDATEVTGSIDAAVENADTGVVVTADAADVTGSITAAVEAADTSVTVDGSVAAGLTEGVGALGDSLDAAASSGVSLGAILSGLSVGAAAAALRSLADSASDLAESTSKAGIVFGSEFPAIQRFATGAADAVGLSTQAALEAAGTFGNLFQALGTSREEAARLSPQVVQLAGDLASFNNLAVDDTLEKIRSGLVGEIEPLRSLGVSFNALQVEAKATELGLGGVGRELTEGEKVQARYALILEQTTLAQGDFARTSDGLANQQRILSAEFHNAAAAAGTALLPAFKDLVTEGQNVLPGLSTLAENVLPAVGEALSALAPLLGTTVDVLVALSPLVQLAAAGLSLIPGPVIQVAAGLLTMNKALVLFRAIAATDLFIGVASGLRVAGSAAVVAAGEFTLAGGAAGGLTGALDALAATSVGASILAAGSAAVVAAGEFTLAGGGAAGFAAGLASLDLAAIPLVVGLAALIAPVVLFNKVIGDAKSEGADFGASLRASFDPATASLSDLRLASADLSGKIVDLQGDVDDSFLGRNGVNRDFNAALNEGIDQARDFRTEINATADALERAQIDDKFGPLITGLTTASEAVGRLRDAVPEAASAITSIRLAGDPSAESLLKLATTLDGAKLSEDQMGDAALLLGTDVTTLKGFIETTTAALTGFTDAAVGGLPSIAEAFRDANNDSKVSAREFIDGLAQDTTELNRFIADLNVIISEGFTEVAGTLATQGVEAAGVAAAQMADAARAGSDVLLEETQAGLDQRDDAIAFSTAFFRDTLGPDFVVAAGDVGALSSDAFATGFTIEEQTRIKTDLAALNLGIGAQHIAELAVVAGADIARQYGSTLDLDQKTIEAAIAAGIAIRNAPTDDAHAGGSRQGQAFHAGFVDGMSLGGSFDIAIAARNLVAVAEQAARDAAEAHSPSELFARLGRDMGDGIVVGLSESGADVVALAEQIVRDAATSVASVAPEVTLAAMPGGGGGTTGDTAGGLMVSFDVTVNPPAGMTPTEARAIGEGIVDGATERLAERRLSIVARTQ